MNFRLDLGPVSVRFGGAKPLRVLLVRHGQSQTNVDKSLHGTIPDPDVALTDCGREQAVAAGAFLHNWLLERRRERIRLYRSDYRRAVQTSDIILGKISDVAELSVRSDDRVRELEFGFSDMIPEQADRTHLEYYDAYSALWSGNAKYYRRRMGGESPADVGDRLRHFIGAMYRDQEKYGISTFIVVNHGLTARVLAKILLKEDRDWYAKEKNPRNCAIRLIEGKIDHGYIHGGVED